MLSLKRWAKSLLWGFVLILSLFIANGLSLHWHGSLYSFKVGWRNDRRLLTGFHSPEEDATGNRYRWTQGASKLLLPGLMGSERLLLTLKVGGIPASSPAPRKLSLTLEHAEWANLPIAKGARFYTLLLPSAPFSKGWGEVGLTSETSRTFPDRRDLGLRLDGINLQWLKGSWLLPPLPTLLAQWLLTVIAILIAQRIELSRRMTFGVAGTVILLLGWLTGNDLFSAGEWQERLLSASVGLILLTWATFPRLRFFFPKATQRTELQWLLATTLLFLALKLAGVLYPPFDSHDWYIHEERIQKLQAGAMLLYDKPAEFSKQIAIVPPAFYVLANPFTLLTPNVVVVMQGFYTFLEGILAFLLALLVRQMGGSKLTSRLTLLLMATLPINFTILWWGFGPQIMGQTLMLLVALFVGQEQDLSQREWLILGLLLCLLLFSHLGAAALAGLTLAGYTALLWLFQQRRAALRWGIVLGGSSLATILLLYTEVIALQLQGLKSSPNVGWSAGDLFRIQWTLQCFQTSFRPIALLLAVFSLLILVYYGRATQRLLLCAWLGSGLCFFAVDLAFGLQVRYAYFIMPLVSGGLGFLLADLMRRGRFGKLISASLVGLVSFAGVFLWFEGIVNGLKPTLTSLTH